MLCLQGRKVNGKRVLFSNIYSAIPFVLTTRFHPQRLARVSMINPRQKRPFPTPTTAHSGLCFFFPLWSIRVGWSTERFAAQFYGHVNISEVVPHDHAVKQPITEVSIRSSTATEPLRQMRMAL
ncbi:hypothetical protein BaRGS_00036094 [Batillaria attramentaria]|uniref:Uncharacterized protein n=1 Tax=Batillaria attramentaria TaxID=370345 RepID=A0ABD0JCC0_9CAEN